MANGKLIAITLGKVVSIFTLLYLFICSLDLLSAAFRLLSVYGLGELVKNGRFDFFQIILISYKHGR